MCYKPVWNIQFCTNSSLITKVAIRHFRLGTHKWQRWFIKSVHFKNTVARSSFLSKLWSFSIQHQLNQNKVSWCIENDHNFERNEDRANFLLKWTDFRKPPLHFYTKVYWISYPQTWIPITGTAIIIIIIII